MIRYVEMGLAFVVCTGVIFIVSVFHAAAVEVSRKPRLALVTDDVMAPVDEAEKEPDLAVAA